MRKSRVAVFVTLALMLSGCSATSALTGAADLIGKKPDVTAQVGAENTKQTVGLNNRTDASTDADNKISNSVVGRVETSSGKKIAASSITADSIVAERIEIRNDDQSSSRYVINAVALCVIVVGLIAAGLLALRQRKKGA